MISWVPNLSKFDLFTHPSNPRILKPCDSTPSLILIPLFVVNTGIHLLYCFKH